MRRDQHPAARPQRRGNLALPALQQRVARCRPATRCGAASLPAAPHSAGRSAGGGDHPIPAPAGAPHSCAANSSPVPRPACGRSPLCSAPAALHNAARSAPSAALTGIAFQPHLLQHNPQGIDRPAQHRGEGQIEAEAGLHQPAPACMASLRPCSVSSTSVQPVKRFSRFQGLCPWRSSTRGNGKEISGQAPACSELLQCLESGLPSQMVGWPSGSPSRSRGRRCACCPY